MKTAIFLILVTAVFAQDQTTTTGAVTTTFTTTTTVAATTTVTITTTVAATTTVALIKFYVSTSISVDILISYSADLSDITSAEYETQSGHIEAIFQDDLEAVATENSMTLDNTTVTFTQSTLTRKRRSTVTGCTIVAVYSVSVTGSTDLSSYADTVSSIVMTAATTAISNSDGKYMRKTATPSVSSSTIAASPCNLFTGECDVKKGYTINIVKACKYLTYPQLPDNNDGMFVYSNTSDAMGSITDVVNNLTETCNFNANGAVNFGFNDCGTLASATTDADTTLTTFIHHQKTIDGTVISLMTEIEVNCVLNHANIVQGQTVAPQESSDFTVAVVAEKKDLKLTVGRMSVEGSFNEVTDGTLTVGEKVRIKLETSNRDEGFSFSLYKCKVLEGETTFELYNNYCLNPDYSFFKANIVDLTNFDINVFRVANSKSLSFDCVVRMHLEGEEPALPVADTCTYSTTVAATRKKRSEDKTMSPETETAVSVTFQILPEVKATPDYAMTVQLCTILIVAVLSL